MCGIIGFISILQVENSSAEFASVGMRMVRAIRHRGPDDEGVWYQEGSRVLLGHARLAIQDLSAFGHQPMISASGKYVIVFNGEIYNHLDLRSELYGFKWRGHSDTETLLAAFEAWGVEKTLKALVGMFSIAIWDMYEEKLVLARDRMGEKPMYYGLVGEGQNAAFVFASELKAIKEHPSFTPKIDRDALSLFMRHCYVPTPYCIYQGIKKLEAGSFLVYDAKSNINSIYKYWDFDCIANREKRDLYSGSEQDAVEDLGVLLSKTIKNQMASDVPLGAFLSGGVDSSTIVALMQNLSSKPIQTFTIGFDNKDFNEADYAKAVASHLSTDHTELYVTPKQALDVIPTLPLSYDEPFADSSQIPTYLVSKLARQKVKVSLSGDGGDELFAGYNRYVLAENTWNRISKVPKKLRNLFSNCVTGISPSLINNSFRPFLPIFPQSLRQKNIGDKLHKAAGVLGSNDIDELYLSLVSQCDPSEYVINADEPHTCLRGKPMPLPNLDPIQRMMYLDTITYLPDDILVKVDRATMANSLEARVPFLDHRVVEFAWTLPQSYKLKNGVGKWVLRELLYKYVPKTLIERPKMGFGVPIDSWLRLELREWAENLLDENRLELEGYFYPAAIRKKWEEHLSGKRNWQYLLWNVLMFQSWLQEENKC